MPRFILHRLRREGRGTALIEFAFGLPVLLLLFVGGFQTMDAVSAYRKVTLTNRTLADLTTQSTSMTQGYAAQILAASRQVMAPYSTANTLMRITQVNVDLTGKATVGWSQALNGQGYTAGAIVQLPAYLNVAGTSLIYAEVKYSYVPAFASTMIGTIPLNGSIYMSPRNSASIPCSDC